MKRYFAGLVLGAALLAPLVAQDAGNAQNGKKLFLKNGCYECHGTMGQGGAGPRLAPRPLAAAALIAYVRKPGNGMPPYSAKVMPDAEVADIRAYLATIPEPPKDIPQLKP
ncbi:MAG TPA: cytochrome c [Bryobacteraceae bacterium]|nr:cytochrome c [Bryobacteraceae bacterium]